jgi:hypothetical protein
MTDYGEIKDRIYQLIAGQSAAKLARDPFELIMRDSNSRWQFDFLMALPTLAPLESDRQILLDGLAREYADMASWMAYAEREGDR